MGLYDWVGDSFKLIRERVSLGREVWSGNDEDEVLEGLDGCSFRASYYVELAVVA